MSQSDSLIHEKESLLEATKREAAALKKDMDRYVGMRVRDELSPERFKEYYAPIETRLLQLEALIPELEAEVDFLNIQYLSSDTVLQEAKDLYDRWPTLPFEEKRNIVELITEQLVIGKDEITIKLSYLPQTPSFQNSGKSQRNLRGSSKQ